MTEFKSAKAGNGTKVHAVRAWTTRDDGSPIYQSGCGVIENLSIASIKIIGELTDHDEITCKGCSKWIDKIGDPR